VKEPYMTGCARGYCDHARHLSHLL